MWQRREAAAASPPRARQLFEACGAKEKNIYVAPGMGHCFDWDEFQEKILFAVTAFFSFKPTEGTVELPAYTLVRPPEAAEAVARARAAAALRAGAHGAQVKGSHATANMLNSAFRPPSPSRTWR